MPASQRVADGQRGVSRLHARTNVVVDGSWTISRRKVVHRCPAVPAAAKTIARSAKLQVGASERRSSRCCRRARAGCGRSGRRRACRRRGPSRSSRWPRPARRARRRRGPAPTSRPPITTARIRRARSESRARRARTGAWTASARERRLLRGLPDHRVAADQRERRVPGPDRDREVERRDRRRPRPSGSQVSVIAWSGRSVAIVRP